MHKAILEASVRKVRERFAEGDCPVTPAYSVEFLEHMVVDLADQVAAVQPREGGGDIGNPISGWKLVPIEPTEAMLSDAGTKTWQNLMRNVWRKMLDAAPVPPAEIERLDRIPKPPVKD